MAEDEHLAYGHYQGEEPGESGIVGDTIKKLGSNEGLSSFFSKLHGVIHEIGSEVTGHVSGQASGVSHAGGVPQERFQSFAGPRRGNHVKWYVDGCGYMWAVSVALERARESIWILDCELFDSYCLRSHDADLRLRVAVTGALSSSTSSRE